jgi:hypothetical protein
MNYDRSHARTLCIFSRVYAHVSAKFETLYLNLTEWLLDGNNVEKDLRAPA